MPAGLAQLVIGGEIGTRRARIAHDRRVPRQHALQLRHHALRPDRARSSEAASAAKASNFAFFAAAITPRTSDRSARAPSARAAVDQSACKRGQAEPRIADERDVGRVVGADHLRVDVDVDDFYTARPGMPPALGRHRAGAAADEDDEVGRRRRSRASATMPPLLPTTPTASGWSLGDAALAADGRARPARRAPRRQAEQLRLGARDDDAAAADEDRAAGRAAGSLGSVAAIAAGSGPVRHAG